ncbi:MAG TPA: SPASM domain-containing protein [Candidatus Hydrogenedentes bacterium]|nr:SPASM domain-containing protein [Candidatus Hydrogenedentota bacterium]HOL75951.1 SPASM domain-containing protein [Candidatus Hydrogenedentota bacterium]HPO85640.1 SPASM domain-containing protein [Candidatus Hydrogenedentota bacterium]
MPKELIHRFQLGGKRFAIDPETCFCFECDDVSWDVLEFYPTASVTRILYELQGRHDPKEIKEVISELEWLRATKSILPHVPADKFVKQFELERGVKFMSLRIPREADEPAKINRRWFNKTRPNVLSSSARNLCLAALELLVGRSLEQKELHFTFLEEKGVTSPDLLAEMGMHALKLASLTGKKIVPKVLLENISLRDLPESVCSHHLSIMLEFSSEADIADILNPLCGDRTFSTSQVLSAMKATGVQGKIVVRPNHPSYETVVSELYRAGFQSIELDLDSAFATHPEIEPESMLQGLRASALFYAESLQSDKYFRLEPIAGLFYRIHEGKPAPRTDPAGLHELAADDAGNLYPSRRFVGNSNFIVGSLQKGTIDETRLLPFNDVGSLTTGVCRRCWARNLCGGGCAAVHAAFTGSFHTPYEPWCNMQREWMASAISTFNILNAAGVNFSRIYAPSASGKKTLSLFTMVRAAMQLTVAMRPIEEADAPLLAKWENWCDASYFVCHPGGLLLATVYEREMDALHPQTLEQEMVLTRRNGDPIGLLRISPDKFPGVAHVAVFLHNPAEYASPDIRKGCRLLLREAGKQQALRKILVYAGDHEPHLHEFLRALDLEPLGTLREALFLHGKYHDVTVFALSTT